jgi:hypothetical protein
MSTRYSTSFLRKLSTGRELPSQLLKAPPHLLIRVGFFVRGTQSTVKGIPSPPLQKGEIKTYPCKPSPYSSPPLGGNVIKLSIRPLILEETLLKKGFFQAIFPKFLKVFGKGFKGKNPFPKGFSP